MTDLYTRRDRLADLLNMSREQRRRAGIRVPFRELQLEMARVLGQIDRSSTRVLMPRDPYDTSGPGQ